MVDHARINNHHRSVWIDPKISTSLVTCKVSLAAQARYTGGVMEAVVQ